MGVAAQLLRKFKESLAWLAFLFATLVDDDAKHSPFYFVFFSRNLAKQFMKSVRIRLKWD